MIKPKFEVGDIVQYKPNNKFVVKIVRRTNDRIHFIYLLPVELQGEEGYEFQNEFFDLNHELYPEYALKKEFNKDLEDLIK